MEGKKILLIDSSKIGIREAFHGNSIKDIDMMITDSNIKAEDAKSLAEDVNLIIC